MYDFATFFAWFVLALLFAVATAFIVWLGSMPKKIAERRNHPQVDAINACSWLGLAFGGVGWAIAFVWAFVRWDGPSTAAAGGTVLPLEEIESLQQRVRDLEEQLRVAQAKE